MISHVLAVQWTRDALVRWPLANAGSESGQVRKHANIQKYKSNMGTIASDIGILKHILVCVSTAFGTGQHDNDN